MNAKTYASTNRPTCWSEIDFAFAEKSVKKLQRRIYVAYVQGNPDCEYVLKSDIESCFDNISHEWLLDNFPIKPELLRKFLKSGFIKDKSYHTSKKGIPQETVQKKILM